MSSQLALRVAAWRRPGSLFAVGSLNEQFPASSQSFGPRSEQPGKQHQSYSYNLIAAPLLALLATGSIQVRHCRDGFTRRRRHRRQSRIASCHNLQPRSCPSVRYAARVQEQSEEEARYEPYAPPVASWTTSQKRFAVGDPAAVEHLQQEGYVVYASVLTDAEVQAAIALFWDFIEASTGGEVLRARPETWGGPLWPGSPHNGIINRSVGQSPFMWFVRTRLPVLQAFADVWGESRPEDLIISFDGACAFRSDANAAWRTRGGWFHTDQNGSSTGSDFHCVQGFVSLTANDESTGCLAALPGSHRRHEELFRRWPLERENDFLLLPRSDPLLAGPDAIAPRLVCCAPGDLVLWDSRCVHCNVPALHRFDAMPLPAALREAGFDDDTVLPVQRNLTSVADAAWTFHTRTPIQLRLLVTQWGVPAESREAVLELLQKWGGELANELSASARGGAEAATDLTRLVAYVCAVPRAHVSSEHLRKRLGAALLGATTTHWPSKLGVIDTSIGQPWVARFADLEPLAFQLMGCETDTRESQLMELRREAEGLIARSDPYHAQQLSKLLAQL